MPKVRILADTLVDDVAYKPSQVVDFPVGVAKSLKQSGVVDDAPEAVAYCINELGVEVIKHEKPAGEAEAAGPAE